MRFVPLVSLILLLTACATGPQRSPPTSATTKRPGSMHQHGHLIGLAASELSELFGAPALQVREGPGLKLQWRGGGCVLDAYLYAPDDGRGVERVTHVDTRLTSGADTDANACEAAVEASR